jgi:P3 major capsid protein
MATATADQIQAANAQARAAILQRGLKMRQPVFTQTVVPANVPVISFNPKNVGLVYGFLVKVTATVANTDGALTLSLSDFNAANLFSNVTFTDLQNQQRINTTGFHVALIDSLKRRRVFGSSVASDSPVKYGNNWNPISAPATIANGASGTVQMYYWIPVSYSDKDFRGAIYANVLSSQMQLSFTFNSAPCVAAGADSTNAIYKGTANGSITTATVQVYQYYYDQIPFVGGQPFLPLVDMATMYELKWTPFPAVTANVETPFPYTNFRDFLSTVAIYNNNGSSTGRVTGADINYWSLKAANTTEIFHLDPATVALECRNNLSTDLPAGCYLFDSRERPIATAAYGNMQLIINPITASAGNYVNILWEDFAMLNTIGGAQSLAG